MEKTTINSGFNTILEEFKNDLYVDKKTGEVSLSYSKNGKYFDIVPLKFCLDLSQEESNLILQMEKTGYVLIGKLDFDGEIPDYLDMIDNKYIIQNNNIIFLDKEIFDDMFGVTKKFSLVEKTKNKLGELFNK